MSCYSPFPFCPVVAKARQEEQLWLLDRTPNLASRLLGPFTAFNFATVGMENQQPLLNPTLTTDRSTPGCLSSGKGGTSSKELGARVLVWPWLHLSSLVPASSSSHTFEPSATLHSQPLVTAGHSVVALWVTCTGLHQPPLWLCCALNVHVLLNSHAE